MLGEPQLERRAMCVVPVRMLLVLLWGEVIRGYPAERPLSSLLHMKYNPKTSYEPRCTLYIICDVLGAADMSNGFGYWSQLQTSPVFPLSR